MSIGYSWNLYWYQLTEAGNFDVLTINFSGLHVYTCTIANVYLLPAYQSYKLMSLLFCLRLIMCIICLYVGIIIFLYIYPYIHAAYMGYLHGYVLA